MDAARTIGIVQKQLELSQMRSQRILFSWIGHADLVAMADDLGGDGRRLLDAARIAGKYGEKPGPLKTTVSAERFDQVHLLSNYPEAVHGPFVEWLGGEPTIHPVALSDPTDYSQVFTAVDQVLTEVSRVSSRKASEWCFLLSPGTPAMAAVWVLLGKSRYPATFYQTFRGQLRKTTIPYDLVDDFVPELFRNPDLNLQHLATRNPCEVSGFEGIVGESQAIRLAVGRAQRAAIRDVSVLLLGESGTGKEMFARAIHAASHRKHHHFEAINCAAIPRELLESELFGHVKGAFTGAERNHDGAFLRADGGTLFLDEVGECEPLMQTKLLRVLQPPPGAGPCRRVFCPVGASEAVSSDVRIVAATNRDLVQDVKTNRFRQDLYHRLAVITLQLPPLRDRRRDISPLAETFLRQINEDFGRQEPGYRHKRISAGGMDFVKRYPWPGNARQLYNTLLQAAVMADGDTLDRQDLVAAAGGLDDAPDLNVLEQPLGDGFNLEEHLKAIQRHYLRRAMEEARGVKTRAADLLGLASYQALDAQLKRLKVELKIPGGPQD
jgi:DNA-binding NtrC family response regulator